MYIFFAESSTFTGVFPFIYGIMLTNGIFEALIAGLVGAPIAHRLQIELRNRT